MLLEPKLRTRKLVPRPRPETPKTRPRPAPPPSPRAPPVPVLLVPPPPRPGPLHDKRPHRIHIPTHPHSVHPLPQPMTDLPQRDQIPIPQLPTHPLQHSLGQSLQPSPLLLLRIHHTNLPRTSFPLYPRHPTPPTRIPQLFSLPPPHRPHGGIQPPPTRRATRRTIRHATIPSRRATIPTRRATRRPPHPTPPTKPLPPPPLIQPILPSASRALGHAELLLGKEAPAAEADGFSRVLREALGAQVEGGAVLRREEGVWVEGGVQGAGGEGEEEEGWVVDFFILFLC